MNLRFQTTLDLKSINTLIKDITYYKDKVLPARCKAFVNELANRGVEIARLQVWDYNAIFTSEVLESISQYEAFAKDDVVKYIIKADSEHAIYVEMGTGIVGAEQPYPGPLPAVYAQGKKMFVTADGKYGWIYPMNTGRVDENGKEIIEFRFTEGMPSRPFMYNTVLELTDIVNDVARQIFWR